MPPQKTACIAAAVGCALALFVPVWANTPPIVSNVTASQQTDGSREVDIRYDLADAEGDSCTVTVRVSSDGGATWTVPVTALSGAVGSSVAPGTGKNIVWDCQVDLPGALGTQFRVQVCADDEKAPPGMTLIPAGEFLMGDAFNEGDSNERPRHAVYVSAFYMDRYEVTNQQYVDALNWAKNEGNLITVISGRVYKYNSGTSYPYCDTMMSWFYSQITWDGSMFGVVAGKGDHPMVLVSWYGSVAYANWRSVREGRQPSYNLSTWVCDFNANGYRLPTEAEWEKAARGGAAGRRFPWSDSDYIQHARANYHSSWYDGAPYPPYDTSPTQGYHPTFNSGVVPYTSPVGYFAPNDYGLYDMTGNVWEWCNDWHSNTYYSGTPYHDPRGPTSGSSHVLRGGCWTENSYSCRAASRGRNGPAVRYSGGGFRCANPTGLHPGAGCGESNLFTVDNRPPPPADFDQDGDVGAEDFVVFAACAAGPAVAHEVGEHCPTADFDGDGDVDSSDFAVFQRCYSGEGNPADPNCAN